MAIDTTRGTSPLSTEAQAIIEQVGRVGEGERVPVSVFNNPEIHELELERIFGQAWVFVGHESEIPNPGDYAKRYIGNDPYIFVRDESGDIRLFLNSCRHRGSEVCRADQGNTTHFRCPYHGWTYDNNGDLVGLPQAEDAYGEVDREEWELFEAPRVTNYEGLIFASLAEDGPTFEEYLGEFKWYLDIHLNLTEGGMEVVGEPQRVTIDANWKIGAENFHGDPLHTATTHHSVIEVGYMPKKWSWAGDRYYVVIGDCDAGGQTVGLFPEEEEIEAFWGYPEEVKEVIRKTNGLSDDQYNIARRSTVHVGGIFPNLSVFHQSLKPDPDADVRSFFNLRTWRPMAPDKVELWNWVLAPAEASDEYKREVYRGGMATFGSTGVFEQDDASVWTGITETAGSQTARKYDLELNYEMGRGQAEVDEEWPGPGFASTDLHDGYARTFHENWYDAMSEETAR